jgi:cell shape-determining protein MreD
MSVLLAIPILAGLLMLQSAILSQVPLLQGTTDLVLVAVLAWAIQKRVRTALQWAVIGGLLVGYVSEIPTVVVLIGYMAAVIIALILKQRVWQVPILAMLVTTFLGSLIAQLSVLVYLRIMEMPLPVFESVNLVILPGVLLNLLLALPFYALFGDLAKWLYPEELEM